MLGVVDASQAEQDEGELERTPLPGGRIGGAAASTLHPGAASPLVGHRPVGQPERLHQIGLGTEQPNTLPDPAQGLPTGIDLIAGGLLVRCPGQSLRLDLLAVDPVFVARCQRLQGLQNLNVGALGQAEHGQCGAVDVRVGVGEQHFHAGSELAPHLGHATPVRAGVADGRRSPVPFGGAAVADCEGRSVTVQQPAGGDLGIVGDVGGWAFDEGVGPVGCAYSEAALEQGERVLEFPLAHLVGVDQGDGDRDRAQDRVGAANVDTQRDPVRQREAEVRVGQSHVHQAVGQGEFDTPPMLLLVRGSTGLAALGGNRVSVRVSGTIDSSLRGDDNRVGHERGKCEGESHGGRATGARRAQLLGGPGLLHLATGLNGRDVQTLVLGLVLPDALLGGSVGGPGVQDTGQVAIDRSVLSQDLLPVIRGGVCGRAEDFPTEAGQEFLVPDPVVLCVTVIYERHAYSSSLLSVFRYRPMPVMRGTIHTPRSPSPALAPAAGLPATVSRVSTHSL